MPPPTPHSPPPSEPLLALPVGMLVGAALVSGGVFVLVWTLVTWFSFGRADVVQAGGAAAVLTSACAVLTSLATVPWIPKPMSTALMAWLAGSGFRMLFALALTLLLYSAPPDGPVAGLVGARTAFLLAIACSFLLGLLVEVAMIARLMNKPRGPEDTAAP